LFPNRKIELVYPQGWPLIPYLQSNTDVRFYDDYKRATANFKYFMDNVFHFYYKDIRYDDIFGVYNTILPPTHIQNYDSMDVNERYYLFPKDDPTLVNDVSIFYDVDGIMT